MNKDSLIRQIHSVLNLYTGDIPEDKKIFRIKEIVKTFIYAIDVIFRSINF